MTRPSLAAHHRKLPAIAVVLLLGWWGAPQPVYCQGRIGITGPSHERYGALQQPVLRPDTIADDSVTEIVTDPAPPRSEQEQNTGTQTPAEQTPNQTQGRAPNQTQDQAQAQANPNPNPAATYQPVTWRNLPVRVLGDQKLVWLFPMHVAQGQHLLPTVGIVGVTGGLIAADSHILVHLRNNTAPFHEFDKIFSGTNTGALTALIPAAFYIYGVAAKSTYSEQTALLAGEAYLDSAIPHVAMKLVSRRLRPNAVPAANDFSDTFFKSKVSVFGKGSSFPSGHAAGIFSVATVVAERYRQYRWVPWVAYGLAAAISFSRVPDFAHFPSDVFMGAALGYTITRYDVLRDRTH